MNANIEWVPSRVETKRPVALPVSSRHNYASRHAHSSVPNCYWCRQPSLAMRIRTMQAEDAAAAKTQAKAAGAAKAQTEANRVILRQNIAAIVSILDADDVEKGGSFCNGERRSYLDLILQQQQQWMVAATRGQCVGVQRMDYTVRAMTCRFGACCSSALNCPYHLVDLSLLLLLC